ncbi:MAG TPA: hypothetical protein VM328_03855 [Fimbriimonadaceae bacterium]|nr:hypothetical protein [Fimbriimonadaceae bacterium]
MSHSPTREPKPLPSLHYLTVQDILWINHRITGRLNRFDYARLEEASFYQYGYGKSNSLVPQAARFLSGFSKLKPFEAGNEATCFVACCAFLLLNGMGLRLADAGGAAWFERIAQAQAAAEDAIAELASPDESVHSDLLQNVSQSVEEVLRRYPQTVEALSRANMIRRIDD